MFTNLLGGRNRKASFVSLNQSRDLEASIDALGFSFYIF